MSSESGAPPLIVLARKRILARFRDAGATSPSAAIPIPGMRLIERREFERMRSAGAVRDAEDGRFWLDEPAATAWVSSRKKRAAVAVAGTLAAGLVAFGLSRRKR